MSTTAPDAPRRTVTNSFLHGAEAGQPPMEELRERYSFLGRLLKKVPGYDSPEMIDMAVARYHQIREANASATFKDGEIEGWRVMILKRHASEVRYAGVREDGGVEQGAAQAAWGASFKAVKAIDIGRSIARELDDNRAFASDILDALALEGSEEDYPGALTHSAENLTIRSDNWLPLSAYAGGAQRLADKEAKKQAKGLSEMLFNARMRNARLKAKEAGDDISALDVSEEILAQKGSKQIFNLLNAALKRSNGRMYGAMAANSMRALDKDTAQLLNGLSEQNMEAANYAAGAIEPPYDELVIDPTIGRNRKQALRAYPFLGRKFIRSGGDLEKVIDTGGELSRHLCEDYNMPPAKMRRLSGLTWQKLGRSVYENPEWFMRDIRMIDVNHIPSTRKGFAEMGAAVSAACVVAGVVSGDREAMVASIGGRFEAISKSLEGNPPEGVLDLRKEIVRRVLRPAIAQRDIGAASREFEALMSASLAGQTLNEHTEADKTCGQNVLQGHSLRSALKASERWHRAIPRINVTLGDGSEFSSSEGNAWEPLAGTIPIKPGLNAVELCSLTALREEGLRQNHCVGGYGPDVKSGETLIYSLRSGEDVLSTVEVRMYEDRKGATEFSVVQNFGHSNDEPGPAAQAAARALKRTLQKTPPTSIDAYKEALPRDHQAQSDNESGKDITASLRNKLCEEAGYDIYDRSKLEQAFEIFREYLPKKDAKLSLDAWTAKIMAPAPRRAQDRASADNLQYW